MLTVLVKTSGLLQLLAHQMSSVVTNSSSTVLVVLVVLSRTIDAPPRPQSVPT